MKYVGVNQPHLKVETSD